jgi:hypothetical protein
MTKSKSPAKASPAKASPKGKGKGVEKKKRARTAFFIFREKRSGGEGQPEMRLPQVAQELGKMWKAMSDAEKKKYTDKAAAEKKALEGQ